MATMNPFDLLGDDDNEDPSLLLAAQEHKLEKPKKAPATAPVKAQSAKPAQLPTKPPPPTQAVRESRNESGREGGRGGGSRGRGGGRGYGRGRGNRDSDRDREFNRDSEFNRDREFNRDSNTNNDSNGFSGGCRPSEEGEGRPSEHRGGYGGPRGSFRGGRRGGFSNGEPGEGEGERPRRFYDRRSGTGRGNEIKRDGSGRGNWGTPSDEIAPETEEPVVENEKNVDAEKQSAEEGTLETGKENAVNEPEEKEPENKEMTLEEYQKVLEEKRKALLALKTEERKVDLDKEFESMQQLSNKKSNDEIFIKVGSEKDKRKDAADKEEKAKKSVSINEFLKPTEGGRYHNPSGRGRGRGRGSRGGFGGHNATGNVHAPKIEDAGEFPSLQGGK